MNYYHVKSAALERQLRLRELEAEAQKVEDAYKTALIANGLDPAQQYRLVDADQSITVVTPEAPDAV